MTYQRQRSATFWFLFGAVTVVLFAMPIAFGGITDFVHAGWLIFLWEMVPLIVGALLWISDRNWYAIFWLIPVAALEVGANFEIFVSPSSSTVGLLGLFVPLWCLIVIGPLALLIGKITRKVVERIQDSGIV